MIYSDILKVDEASLHSLVIFSIKVRWILLHLYKHTYFILNLYV